MAKCAFVLSILLSWWAVASEPTLVFIGDSITQGYGVLPAEAFPERVEKLLLEQGKKVKVVNAGISGSVTAEADRRVRFYAKLKPTIYFICLGANDALKATPVSVIKQNLRAALVEARKTQARIIFAGMRVYTNYGEEYNRELESAYRDLAKEFNLTFIPFLMASVALDKSKMQSDAKHPNALGHEIIAKEVVPVILKELKTVGL